MPLFGKDDFNSENAQRLSVIIMPKVGKPPLFPFRALPEGMKKKFNRIMNEYIQSLGEDWEETLLADFNQIVAEDILNEDFDAAKQPVQEVNTELTIQLTDEQKEFFADKPEELEKIRYTGFKIEMDS
jgi:hypothetical protein